MSVMPQIPWRSLAGKYALLVGALILAAGIALGAASYVAFENSLRSRYYKNTEELARLLGEFTATYMYELRIAELRLVFREIQARSDVLYAYAVDGSSAILANGADQDDHLLDLVRDPLIATAQKSGEQAADLRGNSIHMAMPVRLGSEEVGVVRLGMSLATVNRELAATQRLLAGITFGFVILALSSTFFFLHRTGRRLRQLRGSAQAAAGGRFDMRVDDEGEMEVRALARAFNAMLDAIGEKTQRIYRLAYFDSLTGAANRSRFQEKLDEGLEQCEASGLQLAAMFFDLDRFKQISDTLGHAVGDEILRGFYQTLNACRPADGADTWSMVARLGGDEFTMLIVGRDVRMTAFGVAENILDALRMPMPAENQTLVIGASIGIACYPEDATSKSELLQAADLAMYAAKEAGRNTYRTFVDAMRVGLVDRFALEGQLREAVDKGSFELHYQPVVSLETTAPLGFEALLRWIDSDGNLISPDVFLPVAEESGLILPIGHWVMREACAQARRWHDMFGRPIRVGVNLSARQLEQSDLAASLIELLSDYGDDASWLTLEITETVAMSRPEVISKSLAPLRARGVNITIDDFGTGYSSLSCLQDFAFDVLKIDKSFIADLATIAKEPDTDRRHGQRMHRGTAFAIDHRRQTIIEAIVRMARALDYRIVAEGIESEMQCQLLREVGCEFGQGFLFCKPLSAIDATTWLAERIRCSQWEFNLYAVK
ncbi:MAG: EAL domain-containing protein [Alphaproteobacteria bacterium]|nr:EAL domain-containing protein [Alphaproteobacteria bacterium]